MILSELGTCGIFLYIESTYFFINFLFKRRFPSQINFDRKCKKYHFSSLKKLKNTASAQLWI